MYGMWQAELLNTILGSLSSGVAASTSSYESIASYTATGSETSFTFNSVPGTYASVQIRGLFRTSNTSGTNWFTLIQFNSDTGANYSYHGLRGNGSVASAYGSSSETYGLAIDSGDSATSTLGWGVGIVDIHDYASTTKNKTIRSFTGFDENGDGFVELVSGGWFSTSAITSIKLFFSPGTFSAGSVFSLYGIKGA